MASITQYWHTLRHLRPVQFYGRLWFRLARPRVDNRAAPNLRAKSGTWIEPVCKRQSLLSPTTARFLGVTQAIAAPTIWNDAACEKLWLYNLHYFDDLTALNAADRAQWHAQLVDRWMIENPAPSGNGWEPYPLSLRIVNWIKWRMAGGDLSPSAAQSLAVQTRWLAKRVEHHLLANHLFVNAKALVFAGLFFDGAEAQRWIAQGMRILEREIPEQILPDGGHFERSPMYHALILEDLLDLINAANAWSGQLAPRTIENWNTVACSMTNFLEALTHPDGEIAFFNDASFSVAPKLEQLVAYSQRLGIAPAAQATMATTMRHFRATGYIRAETGSAVLLMDAAPVGPDYQPGHAHADTLSFELSLHGKRVIVNTGTSTYVAGALRTFERSTAAHNTLEIDSLNSSEVWGGFRVARRANIIDVSASQSESSIEITAAHDGYKRLAGRVVHLRQWQLGKDQLTITDTVQGAVSSAVARVYFHPSVKQLTANSVQLASGEALSFEVRGGRARIEAAAWHPEFGVEAGSLCLSCSMTAPEMKLHLRWT